MEKITLKQVRDANPCADGYRKLAEYVRDNAIKEPFSPSVVLDSNGLADTLWVLDNVCGQEGKILCHYFACDAAEHVLWIYESKFPGDDRPRTAIAVKRKWVNGEVDDAASAAASAAARAAARAAASAAVRAADWDAASVSTWAAAWDKEEKWQIQHLRELIEKVLGDG